MEPIKIEKFKTKFTIKSKYDKDLLQIIRNNESRYWNAEKFEWSLPLSAYDSFVNDVKQLNKFDVKIVDNKPCAFIEKNSDNNYDLKFASFVDNFSQFRHLGNTEYNKETRKLTIPATEYENMIKLLKDNQFEFSILETKQEDKKIKKNNKKHILDVCN